ncbi:hypothetical protein KAM429_41350 [Aquipseudomonas alcaligenes]|uniref:Uncharacterized protein n=1 Tax=Aquipseudomonas alcaligenes TaxID=43263 RepID=A0AA37CJZ6_AQUAC|nr:hypothetical protein KAM426_15160 [Pseudomonas alcaligenes]GIZ69203.1 hypothetical protein KAM428_42880 [Pseudomonas alcaligenes]GIZ73374.1 hypothetical protein KAM429_41350 [Pseudomonas alcaligenes]GIZ77764.1 hypothetical protein KAM430_41730 [Pseudomonas alcaligenes]GIZ86448.1 hypothetical protein KAM434_41430 [Pseudomonas alcaligenes]
MKAQHLQNFNACLTDYLREVHCICPKCGGSAIITADSKCAIPWRPFDVKFTCPTCPYRAEWPHPSWKSIFESYNPSDGKEPYFGFNLLAVEQVGGRPLAILSPAHGRDIEYFVSASHRPSPANTKWSMISRLPTWVKLARNRAKDGLK